MKHSSKVFTKNSFLLGKINLYMSELIYRRHFV